MKLFVEDYRKNGMTDLEVVQSAAYDFLQKDEPGELVFDGEYLFDGALVCSPTQNISHRKIFNFTNSKIVGGNVMFSTAGTGKLWRNLVVESPTIENGYLALYGGHEAVENGYEAIYSFEINRPIIQNSTDKPGIIISDAVFEGGIYGGRLESTNPHDITKYGCGVLIQKHTASSLKISDMTISGFRVGVFNEAGDVVCDRLTVLLSSMEGIFYTNNISGCVMNCHMENNCLAGTSTSAIRMLNVIKCINNFGVHNMGNQLSVIDAYSNQPEGVNVIVGSMNLNSDETYCKLKGKTIYDLIGVPTYTAERNVSVRTLMGQEKESRPSWLNRIFS